MANLFDIASGIFFYEFDADTNEVNLSSISGWLRANVGELNNLIYSDLSGDGDFNQEQQNIFKHLYLSQYYKKKSRNAIKAIASSSTNAILSVSDEDSSVSFVNSNEVSKTFRQLSKDHIEELNKLVYAYNMYQAKPVQTVAKSGLTDILFLTGTGHYTAGYQG
jgi:hypothetical protein